jgi:hypothetical protein
MESTSSSEANGALAWASQALGLTAALGLVAKVLGVVVLPGMRGVALQRTVEVCEVASAALSFTVVALLVALVCASSFEVARVSRVGMGVRGAVVGISGLVVALASPAIVMRLPTIASLAMALTTSTIACVGGVVALRAPQTRALGALLIALSFCAVLRVTGWELASVGGAEANPRIYDAGRVLATVGVAVHTLAILLATAWLSARSRFRGRILANGALLLAFGITYLAARTTETTPSAAEAILRTSLGEAALAPAPYFLAGVSAFLVPASILLALVSLVQRSPSPGVAAMLALALLSHGAFDVPLQALAALAATQWAILAMAAGRRPRGQRFGVQQPVSLSRPSIS